MSLDKLPLSETLHTSLDSCLSCVHFATRYDDGEGDSYFPTGYGRCEHLHIFTESEFGCRAHLERTDDY